MIRDTFMHAVVIPAVAASVAAPTVTVVGGSTARDLDCDGFGDSTRPVIFDRAVIGNHIY
jgi:hypothetical protein